MFSIDLYRRYRQGVSIEGLAAETGIRPDRIQQRIQWVQFGYLVSVRVRILVDEVSQFESVQHA
jgi:hypothetical protein